MTIYPPVTSAESLLRDGMLLPSNGSRPTEMSCDEYQAFVVQLLQQVFTVVNTFILFIFVYKHLFTRKLTTCTWSDIKA